MIGTFEIISRAQITMAYAPEDYPKCKCGATFTLRNYANIRGVHQLTSATCKCGEEFTISSVVDGYKSIPLGQQARERYEH